MQASYDLLRAARVLLDMSAVDLATKAGVSKRSLVRIEACEPVGLETSMRVQKALEQEGIEFVPERRKALAYSSAKALSGRSAFRSMIESEAATARRPQLLAHVPTA